MTPDLQDIADTTYAIGGLLMELVDRHPGNEAVVEVVKVFARPMYLVGETFQSLRAEGVIDFVSRAERAAN